MAENSGKTAVRKMPVGRRFRPGESGNPGGRPRRAVLAEAYRAVLAEERDGRTVAELLAAALVKRALRGDVAAAKELCDRTEGKAVAAVDVSLSGDDELLAALYEGRERVARWRERELRGGDTNGRTDHQE